MLNLYILDSSLQPKHYINGLPPIEVNRNYFHLLILSDIIQVKQFNCGGDTKAYYVLISRMSLLLHKGVIDAFDKCQASFIRKNLQAEKQSTCIIETLITREKKKGNRKKPIGVVYIEVFSHEIQSNIFKKKQQEYTKRKKKANITSSTEKYNRT